MRVLTYIRKVLEAYAAGDQDHLSRSLLRDVGSDLPPYEKNVDALVDTIEKLGAVIARLLAGGRLTTDPHPADSRIEEFLIEQLAQYIKSVGDLWGEIPVSVPTKSDLIEVGAMHLVLDRLENGSERISRLDLLSMVLPARMGNLQTMFSEAHFNYLLGNRTAVAIMCRALLEEALKDKAPGNFTIVGDR